jgi:feruloyl esterase
MGHCPGGPGPNAFDALGALEQWVEQGKGPNQIIASHNAGGRMDRTRPLCPYPQVAKYKGAGSTDDAGTLSAGPSRASRSGAGVQSLSEHFGLCNEGGST